jgi:hypothetical protein
MRNLSRRTLLRGTAAAVPVALLAACTQAQIQATITLVQSDLADATNILAGVNELIMAAGVKPTAAWLANEATIEGYASKASALLAQVAGQVGSAVSSVTVQSIFTDLETAASDVAQFVPGNPYVLAAEALLPVLAAAWGLLVPAGANAVPSPMTPDQARALLSQLPRPGLLAGVRQQA